MTKIVVVVDEEHKEIFEGNVEADVGGISSSDLLKIWDSTNKEKYKEIASFKHWIYWRYTE